MAGRNLKVIISPVTFAPVYHGDISADYPICNEINLEKWLDPLKWESPDSYEKLLAVLQAISTIRKGRKKRDVKNVDSRGAKLKSLEDSIANLDNIQGQAVIETVNGVQRIRGLAGSGKTIVLALKAAYLHAQHPEWKIAVTFNTRSLKGQFHYLINTFIIEQTNEEPDWDNLHIINAWGAPGGGDRNGIYYSFCQLNGIEYCDFNLARQCFGRNDSFEGACQEALDNCSNPQEFYDVILIDEAQDFSPAFLRICYEMLKSEKRLVYAYDELQNLTSKSLPSPEKMFGEKDDGTPNVRFTMQRQDIILEKCYRNSRPILTAAHALGFGIYRRPMENTNTGLVQMFENSQLWREVGYEVSEGNLSDGQEVVLSRSEKSSPLFLENHSPLDDLIQFHCFKDKKEQDDWVVSAILDNIFKDELRADDIIVINPDPLTTKDVVGTIREQLLKKGINSHLAGIDSSPDVFFNVDNESITFAGIYRAKGNEAGMVYVINAQDCYYSPWNMATVRNRLFTAITRSKAWVRVLGFGKEMDLLKKEFEQIKKKNFSLQFRYPTEEERMHLNIVNRDMTEEEQKKVKSKKDELAQLINDLETGKIYPEDLGIGHIEHLKRLLERSEK
jgi:superfamily I DNA and RNA helicase